MLRAESKFKFRLVISCTSNTDCQNLESCIFFLSLVRDAASVDQLNNFVKVNMA